MGVALGTDGNWTGTWDTHWPSGSARLVLTQEGNRVTGSYEPGGGAIEGTVTGQNLEGQWRNASRVESFRIGLSGDGNTFFGHFAAGDWWSGQKLGSDKDDGVFEADLSSPRSVLRSFLISANAVRSGQLGYVRSALDSLILPSPRELTLESHTSDLPMLFFDVVDRCTIRFANIPDRVDTTEITLTLRQAGTGESIDITARREDDGWRLVVPSARELQSMLRRLLDARGEALLNPLDHLELRSPRATLRTFLEQYKQWDSGGREYILATMDMSDISAPLRKPMLPLLATYLKETIDRIGYVVWQEVPDDPARTIPYVHFQHPRGAIVIAPVVEDSLVTWKFTAQTLSDIRILYETLEDLPLASSLIPEQEHAIYFYLNQLVRRQAPRLTALRWGLEEWQWLAIIATLLLAIVIAVGFDAVTRRLIRRGLEKQDISARQKLRSHLLLPLAITFAVGGGYLCVTNIGLPLTLFPLLHAVAVTVIGIGLTWTLYNGTNLLQEYLHGRAKKTVSYYDELLVALLGSALKAIVVILGIVFLAREIGIPLSGVLAGLGVGGLAIAIAAKDTLANVFGSVVILADRPFVRGDLVVVSGHEGFVKAVGLRSTQIRTREDSIVSIPNSVLANEVIDNLGRRRLRLVKARVSLTYDTPPDKLEAFANGLLETMEKQSRVSSIRMSAGVWEMAESSIDFEFSCYIDAPTIKVEREERHKLFLDIVRLAQALDVEFAFPTRTLHVAGSSDQAAIGVLDVEEAEG
jgi:small-conductance mechanosensitive channel